MNGHGAGSCWEFLYRAVLCGEERGVLELESPRAVPSRAETVQPTYFETREIQRRARDAARQRVTPSAASGEPSPSVPSQCPLRPGGGTPLGSPHE